MNQIRLLVGEEYSDGHGQKKEFYVRSELNVPLFNQYYQKGIEIIGFDLTEQVANDFEDMTLEEDFLIALIKQGFNPKKFSDFSEEDYDAEEEEYWGEIYLSAELFVDIYMFFVSTGYKNETQKELKWSFAETDPNLIAIGGYGLFR